MRKITVGVFVGSARRDSFNRKVARAICGLLPDKFETRFIEIGHLPMFNQDYDDDGATPVLWREFREAVKGLDAVLFATPEYNRSFPALIKNAIDIASRPYGANAWAGKPGALISVSPGKMGGIASNLALRQPLSFLGVQLLQQPEFYIGDVGVILNDKGELADGDARKFFSGFAAAFAAWVERFATA